MKLVIIAMIGFMAAVQADKHGDHGEDHDTVYTNTEADKVSSGLRIKGARPSIELGTNGDVKLTRSGDNQLQIDANVMMKNLMVDGITVDGVPLKNYVAKIIAEEMANMGSGKGTTEAA